MSMVTFVWAAVIGACATMALPHLLIGIKHRAWQNLFFALAALSVAGIACGELAIMHSATTEQIGRAQQWIHVPIFFFAIAIVGFVHLTLAPAGFGSESPGARCGSYVWSSISFRRRI